MDNTALVRSIWTHACHRHDSLGDRFFGDFLLLVDDHWERKVLIRNQLLDGSKDKGERPNSHRNDVHVEGHWSTFDRLSEHLDEDYLAYDCQSDHYPENRVRADVLEWIHLCFPKNSCVDEVENLKEHENIEEEGVMKGIFMGPYLHLDAAGDVEPSWREVEHEDE